MSSHTSTKFVGQNKNKESDNIQSTNEDINFQVPSHAIYQIPMATVQIVTNFVV